MMMSNEQKSWLLVVVDGQNMRKIREAPFPLHRVRFDTNHKFESVVSTSQNHELVQI